MKGLKKKKRARTCQLGLQQDSSKFNAEQDFLSLRHSLFSCIEKVSSETHTEKKNKKKRVRRSAFRIARINNI